MGDPRKKRKKYSTPKHPWKKERIDEEKLIKKDYGVGNKKEIWKMDSMLKKYSRQAKKIIKMGENGAEESTNFIQKLARLSLLTPNATIDDVLGLKLKDVMERRLQTLVFRKKLSKSVKQARQFIVHGHVSVNGKVITSPSYIVGKDEEDTIAFIENSSLSDPEHPERKEPKKEMPKEEKKEIEENKEEKTETKEKVEEEKESKEIETQEE